MPKAPPPVPVEPLPRRPRFTFPKITLPQVSQRAFVIGVCILVFAISVEVAVIFRAPLMAMAERVAAQFARQAPVVAPVLAPQASSTAPVPVEVSVPGYTLVKLVMHDQRLVAKDADGVRSVLVPSVQAAIPELPLKRALQLRTPVPASGRAVFAAVFPDTDAAVSAFYTYDPASRSFALMPTLTKHYPGYGPLPIAPDGRAALTAFDGTDEERNLYLIDLERDEAVLLDTLPEGETFVSERGMADAPHTRIAWVDNDTATIDIYTEGTEPPEFIRREEITLSREGVTGTSSTQYLLEETAPFRETPLSLIAFTEEGTAVTLVSDVLATFGVLGEFGALSVLSYLPDVGRIVFVGSACNSSPCLGSGEQLYVYDVVSEVFSELSVSNHWNPRMAVSSAGRTYAPMLSADGRYLLSAYDSINYESRGTLYRIDLLRDEAQELGSLSIEHPNDEYESYVRSNDAIEIEWLDGDRFYISVYAGNYAAGGNSDHMVGNSDQLIRKELYSLQSGLISR